MGLRKLLAVCALVAALWPAAAFSQCTGNPAAGRLCGNSASSPTIPGWQTMTSMLDRNFGAPSTQGTVLNRGTSLWSATATPSLGLNGGTGGAITLNGSSTGSATIGVKAAAGTVTFNLPITNGTLNQVLITDGSGNTSWTTAGAGTVSSVGLALPASILTVSGSPVTGTGTLTGALATQSANLVWAGPTTGSAATPTFRSLVGADLPNPSSSSLGGVQSIAAVSHEFLTTISTAGVPSLAQPAFTDISGTLAAAQCPNPSASTIGCVESYVAISHQWINTISTAGVPSSTQPNFTDLSGNASLSQLPSISNSSVLGNNSGGTAVPSALTASNVLDFIASTQGDVLYRNSTGWVALAPGTNGQVLTTAGAAANPTWTTVTGTGTVTSVATNNGITGGTITTTGTIGLATITTGTVLANITGGSAIPIANTPSSILDLIGSTTGDILYRSSGSGWQVLAPGSNGQVLTQGASTPSWSNAGTLTNVTIAAGTGIGVSGTCNITTTGTCTVGMSTARQTLPTVCAGFSGAVCPGAGSGTYTTPSNTLWIEGWITGGGAGGASIGTGGGAGTAGNPSCWNTTGSACTSPVYQAGGGAASAGAIAAGGTVSGSGTCNFSVSGGAGGTTGGASFYGGNGTSLLNNGAATGSAAAANSGSGGGGGSNGSAMNPGGGAGATCYFVITSPAASYTFTVGGTAAGNGSGATAVGGQGAAGNLRIIEHYNS